MMRSVLFKLALAIVLVFGLAFSCEKNSETEYPDGKDLVLTEEEKQKLGKSNQFAIELLTQSSKGLSNDDNLFISPLSVSSALAMTYLGAKEQTREEMRNTLGFDGFQDDLIKAYYKKLIEDLPILDPQTKMTIANSIWYRNDVNILKEFLKTNRDFFHAETNALNFSDARAADKINGWVNNNTQGLIPSIIQQIPDDAVMFLINAIYFKGIWKDPFDAEKTHKGAFRKADGRVIEVDFMEKEQNYQVWSNPEFDAVELPYTNDKYSMILFRPKSESLTGADIVGKLAETENIIGIVRDASRSRKTKLKLPKFKFAYENKLNDELQALGMRIPFTDAANFSGINGSGQLKIDEVKHKAFVEVNEEGTEAAAATSVGISVTSMPIIFNLTFDRPFVFVIQEKSSGLLVFMGAVNDPLSTETKAD